MSQNPLFLDLQYTVVVAQLVRASVCGTEGRGFEPHRGAFFKPLFRKKGFFNCKASAFY